MIEIILSGKKNSHKVMTLVEQYSGNQWAPNKSPCATLTIFFIILYLNSQTVHILAISRTRKGSMCGVS
jgi:hypothetical protein